MSSRQSPAKNWCVTINNYTDDVLGAFKIFVTDQCNYGICQLEIAPTTLTPHIQAYVQLKEKKRLTFIKGFFPTAHLEKARGTAEQNVEYCSKEGGTGLWSHGNYISEGKCRGLEDAIALIKQGGTLSTVANDLSDTWVKHHRGLIELAGRISLRRDFVPEVFWFYGATGTGKSREAASQAPEAFYKMGGNKWWDGYDNHEAVIIDDYRRDLCTFSELLRMLDRYPYRLEVKGGSCEFAARRIYITTPKSPEDTWEGRSDEDIAQLTRRITKITHFNNSFFTK